MFKRLVSNLPYSPALIGQMGFYASRLRQEEFTRRLGLIFTILALLVQSLVFINPPEAQAIASPQNMIFEGVKNKSDLLNIYDNGADQVGHKDIQQIFTQFDIERKNLIEASEGSFNSLDFNGSIWSVGRKSYDAGTKYEKTYTIQGAKDSVYARKLWRYDASPNTLKQGTDYEALIGTRDDGSWFAVIFNCGNIAYVKGPTIANRQAEPCPNNPAILAKNEACEPEIKASKTVTNLTQGLADANGSTAKLGDELKYNLSIENTSKTAASYAMRDDLTDVLEYAELVDVNGAIVESDKSGSSGILAWPAITLKPGQKVTKSVVVRIKDKVPATPQNVGNPESYNCVLTNSFGTSTNINVECPAAKMVERTVSQLPSTDIKGNVIFSVILLAVVVYFYARSRQLKKEIRMLRREFASGSL